MHGGYATKIPLEASTLLINKRKLQQIKKDYNRIHLEVLVPLRTTLASFIPIFMNSISTTLNISQVVEITSLCHNKKHKTTSYHKPLLP